MRGENLSTGDGVKGASADGIGVHAVTVTGQALRAVATGVGIGMLVQTQGNGPAIVASSQVGPTAALSSANGVGAQVSSGGTDRPALVAEGFNGPGVFGMAHPVVVGYSELPHAGVIGMSDKQMGGYFASDSGTALKVDGKLSFSRGGRFKIGVGILSKLIQVQGVTPHSYVLATIQNNRAGIWIRAVVPGTDQFTVYFNAASAQEFLIGYLVLN